MTLRNAPKQLGPAITITALEPDEVMPLIERLTGFRQVEVAGQLFVIPSDPAHPDFGSCERRIVRAKKKAGLA